ncbi:hypothetical protein V8F06_004778 [Rhypophila decipiens]
MLVSTLFISLFSAGVLSSAVEVREGHKIYARASEFDLGFGTAVFEGVTYALPAPPSGSDMKKWFITNTNGTDIPHWKYLPNAKTGLPSMPDDDTTTNSTSEVVGTLSKRQRPPQYMEYFDAPRCVQRNRRLTPPPLDRCVATGSRFAWGSTYTGPFSTCPFITVYYNSGCAGGSICQGFVIQTLDWQGCYTPPTIFCSAYHICCITGC